MRILLLSWAGSVHTLRIAHSLSSRGIRVDVASFTPGCIPGVPVHVLGLGKRLGRLGYLLNLSMLRRLLSELAPDILHAHYISSYGILATLSGFRPLVLSVWGSDIFDFPRRGLLPRWMVRHNLESADAILSTSRFMASEVARYTDREVRITPFGVDVDLFRPVSAVRPVGPMIVGSVKALEPQYGMDVVIRAFALTVSRWKGAPLRLEIVGRGHEEGRLRSLAGSLGISGLVDFPGFVKNTELPARIRRYSLAAFGSVCQESFGVALLEAQACGVPVVASDVGGFREVVKHGTTGILVKRGDYTAMAEAMTSLLGNSEKRQAFSRAARRFVVKEYLWDKTVDQFVEIYKQVLSSHP